MLVHRRQFLWSAVAGLEAWQVEAAGPEFWDSKPPDAWTKKEIEKLLKNSPWAKSIAVPYRAKETVTTNKQPTASERKRGAIPTTKTQTKNVTLHHTGIVRWDSAPPIMIARHGTIPDKLKGHYLISVIGVALLKEGPGAGRGVRRLQSLAWLEVPEKPPVKPAMVLEDSDSDKSFLYCFRSDELSISEEDKHIDFNLSETASARFTPKTMMFQGKLAVIPAA